jgi:hypothetical protein
MCSCNTHRATATALFQVQITTGVNSLYLHSRVAYQSRALLRSRRSPYSHVWFDLKHDVFVAILSGGSCIWPKSINYTSASCERAHSEVNPIKSAAWVSTSCDRSEDLVQMSSEEFVVRISPSSVIDAQLCSKWHRNCMPLKSLTVHKSAIFLWRYTWIEWIIFRVFRLCICKVTHFSMWYDL